MKIYFLIFFIDFINLRKNQKTQRKAFLDIQREIQQLNELEDTPENAFKQINSQKKVFNTKVIFRPTKKRQLKLPGIKEALNTIQYRESSHKQMQNLQRKLQSPSFITENNPFIDSNEDIQSQNKNPIIVVNSNPIHFTSYMNSNSTSIGTPPINANPTTFQQEIQEFQKQTSITQQNSTITEIRYEKLSTLITYSQNVKDIYNDIFDAMPEASTNDKGSMSSTKNLIDFFNQVKNLVNVIFQNNNNLKNYIDYIKETTDQIGIKKDEMIQFYGQRYQYNDIYNKFLNLSKKSQDRYEDEVQKYDGEIEDIKDDYEDELKPLKFHAQQLKKMNDYFEREIDAIIYSSQQTTIVNALDNFDKTLIITLKMLELKKNLYDHLDEIQDRLHALNDFKNSLETQINNINQVVIKAEAFNRRVLYSKFSNIYIVSLILWTLFQ